MNPDSAESEEAINQDEWEQSANWSGGYYSSKRDTRLWVPKRAMTGTGLTLNFAHPSAKVTFATMCAVPVGLLLLFVLLQFMN